MSFFTIFCHKKTAKNLKIYLFEDKQIALMEIFLTICLKPLTVVIVALAFVVFSPLSLYKLIFTLYTTFGVIVCLT